MAIDNRIRHININTTTAYTQNTAFAGVSFTATRDSALRIHVTLDTGGGQFQYIRGSDSKVFTLFDGALLSANTPAEASFDIVNGETYTFRYTGANGNIEEFLVTELLEG